jgi:hypothetical protein
MYLVVLEVWTLRAYASELALVMIPTEQKQKYILQRVEPLLANDSANTYCLKRCFQLVRCKWVIRKTTEVSSWKGAAVQSGLQHGNKGIIIVRSRCQETSNEDTED